MYITIWRSWIQWVLGLYLWLSQLELLLWIKIWTHHPPNIGKSQSTWIYFGHTCSFQATQQFPCCRSWYFLRWWYLGWPRKGPGASQMMLLSQSLVLDLDLGLKVRYSEMELKLLIDNLFYDLIAWLPCTGCGSVLKNVSEVAGFLNSATWVYIFCYDLIA